jgi:UDPglucose 6-dehydrogenase
MTLGFIGQGWIGKNLADHFEERGFSIVRYAKEPEFEGNKDAIAECDIVFIAVPTPSTPEGFDDRILRGVLSLVGKGKIAVIKSTILPGTTDELAAEYPDRYIMHAPEFLRETSVRHDIDYPDRNIIGIPSQYFEHEDWRRHAQEVLAVLPDAPYEALCKAPEAELTKYGGNNFLYVKVVFMNLLYDLATHHGARWETVAENMKADPRIGSSHMQPVHQYAHMGGNQGRGAGGHCFIKDFAAFRQLFEERLSHDQEAILLLRAFEAKNNKMLRDTGKDLDLLEGVYGNIGDGIVGMEEALMKEGNDVEAMQKAYDKKDLATLEAAYARAGKDLAALECAYANAGGDIQTLKALL